MNVPATRGLVLPVALAFAALLAAIALAANSVSFLDAERDSGASPDVAAVAISDDGGTVMVKITVANRSVLASADEVGFGIDTDQNPDTGTVFFGSELFVNLAGSRVEVYRSEPSGFFGDAPIPASLQGGFAGGVATFSFRAADLNLGPTSGFNIYALGHTEPGRTDTAPNFRAFNYQQVPGSAPPAPGPDTRAPLTEAVRSVGVHGRTARLYYFAGDGRGETADTIRVYRGRRVLKTIQFSLGDTNPYFAYFAPWRIPRSVRGRLRFCVSSVDRALNRGRASCAPLIVK